MPQNSKINFRAARVVMSPLSNGGDTSTTSSPTSFESAVATRRKSSACRVESPPADGISVPGADELELFGVIVPPACDHHPRRADARNLQGPAHRAAAGPAAAAREVAQV